MANEASLIDRIRAGELFPPGTALEGADGIAAIAALLEGNVTPDFATVMIAESGVPRRFEGIEGFKEGLGDWISPYERFRLVIEGTIVGDEAIVFLARQVAVTKHGGVEVETPSASVWWLSDDGITGASFYLDRQAAFEATGIDPDSVPG